MDFIHPIVIAEFFVKGLDKYQIVVHDKQFFEFRRSNCLHFWETPLAFP